MTMNKQQPFYPGQSHRRGASKTSMPSEVNAIVIHGHALRPRMDTRQPAHPITRAHGLWLNPTALSSYLPFFLLAATLMAIPLHAQTAKPLPAKSTAIPKAVNNIPKDWVASGQGSAVTTPDGKIAVTVKPGGRLTLSQKITVTPGDTYLLKALVQGDGIAVASAGALPMSYNKQGHPQLITGLVRPSTPSVTFRLEFAPLPDKPDQPDQPAQFTLDPASLSLIPYTLPSTAPARPSLHNPSTLLTQQGKPFAAIVYPSGLPAYEALAKKIQAAIEARTGVTLPLLDDKQATLPDAPTLKPEYQSKNLILLGRLGISRAFWPAYTQLLAGSDGHYPGPQGHEVRTACNVSHTGANHLIIGSSSDDAMPAAVDQFINLLPKNSATPGNYAVPFLHDLKLSGRVLDQFNADDALWQQTDQALLPPVEPGYGSVRRWYQNALGYYWTARPSYQARMNSELDHILADKAYTHHYIAEFMIRVFDQLDDTPIIPPSKIAQMDSLILSNFLESTIGPDLTWMTRFSPPYRNVKIVNRHQVSPWMADWKEADFLQSRLPLSGDLASLVQFRHDEKRAFFDYASANRWAASLPVPQLPESDEETVSSFFRFAFDTSQYDYFTSGHAKNALLLDRINHVTGHLMRPSGNIDHQLTTGILASYYADPGFAWLNANLTKPAEVFMGRYVAGVSRFTPGPEITPTPPTQTLGVNVYQTFPDNIAAYPSLSSGRFKADLPKGTPLDFISLRSGFSPSDDYLAVSGIIGSGPPGAIASFSSGGTQWLSAGNAGTLSPASDLYYENNAVDIARLDKWLGDDQKPYAGIAQLLWHANLKSAGGFAYTLAPFMDTRWTRQIIWLAPGLYVFRDTIVPTASGKFSVSVNFHPATGGSFDGETWTSVSKRGNLRITPVAKDFTFTHNLPEYLAGDTPRPTLRTLREGNLTAGQPLIAVHLLESLPPGAAPCTLQSADGILYSLRKQGQSAGFISFDPARLPGIKTDANVLALTDRGLMILGATFLDFQGARLFTTPDPSKQKSDTLLPPDSLSPDTAARLTAAASIPANQPLIKLPAQEAKSALPAAAAQNLQTLWQYQGLSQSTLIKTASQAAPGIIDLGKTADLVEIRAVRSGRFWSLSPMPEIWLSEGDANGSSSMPASDAGGSRWNKVTQTPQWHPAVQTGNYGKSEPIAEAYQSLILPGLKARYVKFTPAARLLFFDASAPGLRSPVSLQTDLPGNRILITGEYNPPFVRASQEQTNLLAVLTPDGKPLFRDDPAMPTQSAHPTAGPIGPDSIGVLSVDAQLRWLNADGITAKSADLQKMHADFNLKFGQPNTRSPAGGFTMPFAFGSWRPTPDGRAKTIVARYGALTFLDENAQFEGVNMTGGYVIAGLLPQGVDFDSDGQQDQLALSRGAIIRISGQPEPKIKNPGSAITFPEAYDTKNLPEPDFDARINGAPIHAFEVINNPYVLVIRENYVGVYDGKNHKWAMTWTPIVPIRSGALIRNTNGTFHLLLQTFDGLLYRLWWDGDPVGTPHFTCAGFADNITHIKYVTNSPGLALLITRNGLYLHDPSGPLTRLSNQGWSDARATLNPGKITLTGIDLRGIIQQINLPFQ